MYKKGVSVFILTKNCEATVKKTLESVKWAGQVVVVDGYSTDKTLELCRKYGAEIHQRAFEGFDKERNFAISKCKHAWIFEIDADECLSQETQEDIKHIVKQGPSQDYFILRRRDYYLRQYLITLKLIRFYRNGIAHYINPTHEKIIIKKGSKKGRVLKGYAEHKATDTDSIFDDVRQMDRETEKELLKRFRGKDMGRLMLALNMTLRPIFLFFAIYLYKGFFRSGMTGLIWSLNNSYYEFLIYVKYYERKYVQKKKSLFIKQKMREI